jgi:hypothetical protein
MNPSPTLVVEFFCGAPCEGEPNFAPEHGCRSKFQQVRVGDMTLGAGEQRTGRRRGRPTRILGFAEFNISSAFNDLIWGGRIVSDSTPDKAQDRQRSGTMPYTINLQLDRMG